jgi:hypothetical protein
MVAIDPLAGTALTEPLKAAARKQLARLAAQDDQPALRDLARDVLGGKTDLRGAILGPRYTDLLNEHARQYSDWYRNLSAEERAEQTRQGQTFAAQARQEEIAERRPARRPRPATDEEEGDVQQTILKKRQPRR